MKVILLKDVKAIGRAHETVTVKDGFALNFLIPKKLAAPATDAALAQAKSRLAQDRARKEVEHKLVAERLAALAEATLTVRKKANEKGHLYDALDAKELAELAQLPIDAIRIEKPFKELGTFDVPVAAGESFGKFSITVEAE